jgi:hypothetical protein
MSPEQVREENAYTLGVQVYLWGFPLQFYGVLVPGSVKAGGTYVNDFHKFTDLKTAKDRFIVTPNNVTIDSYCNFDVTSEPLVLFVPKLSAPRWYIVQIGDSFDEVIYNVGGIKGEQPGVYMITGPDFVGDIPGDMVQVKSRTRIGALGVRVLSAARQIYPARVKRKTDFRRCPCQTICVTDSATSGQPSDPRSLRIKAPLQRTYDTSMNSATGCASSYR